MKTQKQIMEEIENLKEDERNWMIYQDQSSCIKQMISVLEWVLEDDHE